MAQIELDGISKRFADGTLAVDDVTLQIEDGEFFILVGPSGCGKSTLLNVIVGLEPVTRGTLRLDDRVINNVDPKNRNMAMVFQSYAIYPHMSVADNLAFPLKLAKLDRQTIRRRVQRAAEILELEPLLGRKPASLSGGQRQRVAMGRAIVREPAVFLMDEPLSNLDAKLRIQMRAELARLQRRLNVTTVYVTHDQTEAMTLGDRIAVMRAGRVQQVGTPQALYGQPANLFVAGFIGSPAMNLIPAHVDGGKVVLPMAQVDRFAESMPTRLIAGLRPEQLEQPREGSAHAVRFRATVDVVEWTGAEAFAHLRLDPAGEGFAADVAGVDLPELEDGLPMIARLPPDSGAREGEEIELAIKPQNIHWFDGETGERV